MIIDASQPYFSERGHYQIRVKGKLDANWADWFDGLTLIAEEHPDGPTTLIAGLVPDQAALHSVLERIRDLNLQLLTVERVKPE